MTCKNLKGKIGDHSEQGEHLKRWGSTVFADIVLARIKMVLTLSPTGPGGPTEPGSPRGPRFPSSP